MPAPKTLKTVADTRKFMEMTASRQDWRLNRDERFIMMLAEGLTINFNRYGYYSCPCRDADGIKEKDKDIICPCAYCRPDQDQYGHCYCGLYLTPRFFASKKAPMSIPERRPL